MVRFENNAIILVKKGSKIMHSANEDFEIKSGEALFLRAGSYTLSNIALENGTYEALLFFFDNAFLLNLMQKYRTKVPKFSHTSELALKTKDEKLLEILKDFDKFFEKNTQIFAPLIVLKFEEIFLHLSLKDAKFQGFLSEILGEIDRKYARLFGECDAEFLSVSDMAHFAKSDISTFSKHFKQNFKLPPKKYLDEKTLPKSQGFTRIFHAKHQRNLHDLWI